MIRPIHPATRPAAHPFVGRTGSASAPPTDDGGPLDTRGAAPASFLVEDLHRQWRHSFEEDLDSTEIYRRSSFPFPPAPARDGFELGRNGSYLDLAIGAADGTVATRGSWRVVAPLRIAVRLPDRPVEIVELTLDESGRLLRRPAATTTPTRFGLIDSEDWQATIEPDRRTRRPVVLVQGTLIFATPGFEARLVTHEPQGIDPHALLLDLEIVAPTRVQAEVVTRQKIRFTADDTDLREVTILTIGTDIPVGAVA